LIKNDIINKDKTADKNRKSRDDSLNW